MVKKFTKAMATNFANSMVKSGGNKFRVTYDGYQGRLLFNGKALHAFRLYTPDEGHNVSKHILKVNLNDFKDERGRILVKKLVAYLLKEVNKMVVRKHQKELEEDDYTRTNGVALLNIEEDLSESDKSDEYELG